MPTRQKQQHLPIYVIALASSKDRRKKMSKRLDALGLDFTFFDAVAGKALSDAEIAEVIIPDRQNYLPTPFSPEAVGCALSHLEVWKKIAGGDAPMALIFEDDAEPTQDLIPILNKLEQLGDKIDIVNLNYRAKGTLVDIAPLSPTHMLTSCRYNTLGAESYVITRSAAAHLAERYLPMIYEVDIFMNRWWDHGLHILTVNPPVVYEDSSPSTIGYPETLPRWRNDRLLERLRRRLSRFLSSMQKRKLYPTMVAAAKMRLAEQTDDE